MKNKILILASLFFLVSCTSLLGAGEVQKIDPKQDLIQGKNFQGEHEQYVHLPELRAEKEQSATAIVQTTTKDSRQILNKKGGFIIYKTDQLMEKVSSGEEQNINAKAVVWNERTKQYGIVTGVIKVAFYNSEDAENFADDFSAVLIRNYARIKFAYYQTDEGVDLVEVAERMTQDKRTKNAYPEILENFMVAY